MIYLEFIDFGDYIEHLPRLNKGRAPLITHLDVLDASEPGQFAFYIVATACSDGVLAVCSRSCAIAEEPEPEAAKKIRDKFYADLRQQIEKARAEVAALFQQAGVKVRPGIYSIDPPAVLRHRK